MKLTFLTLDMSSRKKSKEPCAGKEGMIISILFPLQGSLRELKLLCISVSSRFSRIDLDFAKSLKLLNSPAGSFLIIRI